MLRSDDIFCLDALERTGPSCPGAYRAAACTGVALALRSKNAAPMEKRRQASERLYRGTKAADRDHKRHRSLEPMAPIPIAKLMLHQHDSRSSQQKAAFRSLAVLRATCVRCRWPTHKLCGAARDYVQVIQKGSDGTVEICAPKDWAGDNSDLFRQEQRAPRPGSQNTRKMLWCDISLGGSLAVSA